MTRTLLRHRRWVFAFWLVAFLAGGFAASQVPNRLTLDFSLPGQEGYETEVKLIDAYGHGAYPAYIPVLTAPAGETIAEHKDGVAAVTAALVKIPGVSVIDYAGTNDEGFVTDDGRSVFSLVYSPMPTSFTDPLVPQVNAALEQSAAAAGLELKTTGYMQLSAGSEESEGPSVLFETLIGAGGALVVLIFVFASFLALVPLVVAAVSILSTFLAVLALTYVSDVSFVVQFLIALVGLGVAIDYSLLVVSRWREERQKGATNDEAVVTAVRTAGHAVFASGITVAISLFALVVVPVPLLRSMGFGGMLIPLMSTLVVLTLLPAMLSVIGPRLDWPHIRHEDKISRGWAAWARGVVKARYLAAGVALAVLGLLIAPVFGLQIGQASSESLASNGPAHDGLVTLADGGIGSGVVTPITIMVDGGDPARFISAAEAVDGVHMAVAAEPGNGGLIDVEVIPDQETVASSSIEVVDAVRAAVADLPGFDGVAGLGASVTDYQAAVYDRFPYVLALIAVVTFVLLMRTFRSVLLPLKAVLLNLISVTAVFGLATWFWQDGHGSQALFGVSETGAMTFWLPVLIFAFLFGLSMDYEVFILARMREEYDRTGDTSAAVVEGLGRTGRLVTSAALILFLSFAALAGTPGTEIKVMATALGAGILLDATIVRALLVPALVSLFGRWNWWLPGWLAKVLRVEPSPLAPKASGRPVPEKEQEPAVTG